MLGDRHGWEPQRPKKGLSNNRADDDEGNQDEADPAIEGKSIFSGHGTVPVVILGR